ncbi:MAG: TorD/DmsD family molecular chaperone [Thermodesulfobacteriota bacterium]
MPLKEKAFFCDIISFLLCPPDQEMVEPLTQGHLHSFFKAYVQSWEGEIGILKGFLPKPSSQLLLEDLKEEYHRLFSDTGKERISLVESFYKPWTQDPHCFLPFAKEKGFLMGDSAIHLLAIFQQCGIEVSDSFKGMPDHLVIELEFLSYLYQKAEDQVIERFIKDHLDWIPLLKEACERANAHPFYMSLIDVLHLFIQKEKERLERKRDGKKEIYPEVV